MRKITSLFTFLLMLVVSVAAYATRIEVPVTVATGDYYRNGAVNNTIGTSVNRWDGKGDYAGVRLKFGTGTVNHMQVRASGPQMHSHSDSYFVSYSGSDYRVVGFKITSTAGAVTLQGAVPAGVTQTTSHTFSTAASEFVVDYSAAKVNLTSIAFRVTATTSENTAVVIYLDEKLTTSEVTFNIFSDDAKVIKRREVTVSMAHGATIATEADLPAEVLSGKPAFTTFVPEATTVTPTTTSVDVVATTALPFEVSTPYLLKIGQGDARVGYLSSATSTTPLKAPATIDENATGTWTLQGNIWDGFTVTDGNGKYLAFTADNSTTIQDAAYTWTVKAGDASIANGFSLWNGSNGINKWSSGDVKSWTQVDKGSTFVVEVPVDYELYKDGALFKTYKMGYAPSYEVTQADTLAVLRPFSRLTITEGLGAISDNMARKIKADVTLTGPFDPANAGKEFLIKTGNGYFLNAESPYRMTNVADYPSNFRWKIEGNPYETVTVKNGENYLRVLEPNAAGQTSKVTVDATANAFTMGRINAEGGFSLKEGRMYLNVNGNSGDPTVYLTLQGYYAVDVNSTLYLQAVPDDFKPVIEQDFGPAMTFGKGHLFGLTDAKYDEAKAIYDEVMAKAQATDADYARLKAVVGEAANYNLPETGYYRLRNKTDEGAYMYLNGQRLYANKDKANAVSDPSTIIYVEKQADDSYTLYAAGEPFTAAWNANTTVGGAATPMKIAYGELGYGLITWDNDTKSLFLFQNTGGVHTYSKGYQAPFWAFEKADTLTLALRAAGDGKSYATTFLPYPVKVTSTDVQAYGVAQDGTATAYTAVPKATGILFMSESEASEVKLAINAEEGTPLAADANVLTGTYLRKSITANSVLTFGRDAANASKVGFYRTTLDYIPTFRAYIDGTIFSAGAPSNGFEVRFGEVTGIDALDVEKKNGEAIIDLSGRRVSKATRGVYIINGKKTIR